MDQYENLTSLLYGLYKTIPFPFAPSRNIKHRCEYDSKCQSVNPVVVDINPLVHFSSYSYPTARYSRPCTIDTVQDSINAPRLAMTPALYIGDLPSDTTRLTAKPNTCYSRLSLDPGRERPLRTLHVYDRSPLQIAQWKGHFLYGVNA